MALPEGKAAATNRLTQEGRWSEASAFKDSRISEHRKAGMKRPDAQELAWQEMLDKYPPIANTSADDSALDDGGIDVADLPESQGVSLVDDIMWCYSVLEIKCPNLSDAPSRGAVGLLKWARKDRDSFFKLLASKAMAAAPKAAGGAEASDDEWGEFQRWKANTAHTRMIREMVMKKPVEEHSLQEWLYGPDWDPSKEKKIWHPSDEDLARVEADSSENPRTVQVGNSSGELDS
jgi:hypothetical protein